MSEDFDPKRRRFSVGAALALLGFPLISIGGCGGGSSTPAGPSTPNPTPTPSGGISGSVTANHAAPHVATITAAQLGAGAGLTLDISNGLHSHAVILTSAQVTQIAARARVSVASSTDPHSGGTDPHSHTVTFN